MPAPGLCGVRDVRIERPDGRNHTGRGCRGGGGRKHIELAGDPEGREINMARRPVAGAARLGSVRLFVDVTGRYRTQRPKRKRPSARGRLRSVADYDKEIERNQRLRSRSLARSRAPQGEGAARCREEGA